jgi:hypothetical protein
VSFRLAIGGVLVAALIALPAGAAARPSHKAMHDPQAAGMCGQERAKLGRQAFRRKYGLEHPGRACVKVTRQLINAAGRVATDECRDELASLGPEDFIDEYGEDATSTVDDAMSECIAEVVDVILNPEAEIDDE